jgi:hypothetical protein
MELRGAHSAKPFLLSVSEAAVSELQFLSTASSRDVELKIRKPSICRTP